MQPTANSVTVREKLQNCVREEVKNWWEIPEQVRSLKLVFVKHFHLISQDELKIPKPRKPLDIFHQTSRA